MFNFLFSAEERIPSEVEILLGGDKKQDKQEHRHWKGKWKKNLE